MNRESLNLAKRILEAWISGFNTNNWNNYIQLLSDNYIFKISNEKNEKHDSSHNTLVLFEYLKGQGIEKITSDPIRITSNEKTVVFEFQEPLAKTNGSAGFARFALSFDFENGLITTYREYYGSTQ